MAKPALLILAGGIGSRYGGFKQIDPIGPNGEVIIDYSIFDALRAGFGKIVIVTVPELEAPLREHLSRTLGDGFELVFVFQQVGDLPPGFSAPADRKKPWGTGHAIWTARHVIDTPFGVVNADDFYGPTSYEVLARALTSKVDAKHCAMVGFELAKTLSEHGTVSRGIGQADADGFLVDIVENTTIEPDPANPGEARSQQADGTWAPLSGRSITSMNLWGFDPSLFGHLDAGLRTFLEAHGNEAKSEYFIPFVVDELIQRGELRCHVLHSQEKWFGMTYQQDREEAGEAVRRLVSERVYPETLRLS